MASRKTLLVDFDGVLHDYHGWTGPIPQGQPVEKARAAMYSLEKTYRLICFTTRPVEPTERWLRQYGFPQMKVTNVKEPAHLIIDDRAITFTGTWDNALLTRITSFIPYWHAQLPSSHADADVQPTTQPDQLTPSLTLPESSS